MMILQALGSRHGFGPLSRAHARLVAQVHTFVLTRLVSFNCSDVRWTLATMALRVFVLASAFGERQLAAWATAVLNRAWQGARFAAELEDADTMVAAGRR